MTRLLFSLKALLWILRRSTLGRRSREMKKGGSIFSCAPEKANIYSGFLTGQTIWELRVAVAGKVEGGLQAYNLVLMHIDETGLTFFPVGMKRYSKEFEDDNKRPSRQS